MQKKTLVCCKNGMRPAKMIIRGRLGGRDFEGKWLVAADVRLVASVEESLWKCPAN